VIRLLEVVGGIVGHRRCARANLAVQLRERYSEFITRERVSFNFVHGNRLRCTAPSKQNKESMMIYFGEEMTVLEKGYYKDRNIIKQPKLNPVTVIVTPVFPVRRLISSRDLVQIDLRGGSCS